MSRWSSGLIALCIVLAVVSGCSSRNVPVVEEAPKPEPESTPLASVPDLTGKTLSEAYGLLGNLETTVVVVFPAAETTGVVPAHTTAGVFKPEHVTRFSIDNRPLPLAEVSKPGRDGFEHSIVEQSPQPGTPLEGLAMITLRPGPHPGSATTLWLVGHRTYVEDNGAAPCFDCHDEEACGHCHTRVSD
ncbi:MAG: hypothetical protein Q8K99_10050 [Actinomycetota bacterium]|nr:hypothetical protein [Actinomycetota bacterium]